MQSLAAKSSQNQTPPDLAVVCQETVEHVFRALANYGRIVQKTEYLTGAISQIAQLHLQPAEIQDPSFLVARKMIQIFTTKGESTPPQKHERQVALESYIAGVIDAQRFRLAPCRNITPSQRQARLLDETSDVV